MEKHDRCQRLEMAVRRGVVSSALLCASRRKASSWRIEALLRIMRVQAHTVTVEWLFCWNLEVYMSGTHPSGHQANPTMKT